MNFIKTLLSKKINKTKTGLSLVETIISIFVLWIWLAGAYTTFQYVSNFSSTIAENQKHFDAQKMITDTIISYRENIGLGFLWLVNEWDTVYFYLYSLPYICDWKFLLTNCQEIEDFSTLTNNQKDKIVYSIKFRELNENEYSPYLDWNFRIAPVWQGGFSYRVKATLFWNNLYKLTLYSKINNIKITESTFYISTVGIKELNE